MDHLLHWVSCEEASLMGLFDLAASPHPPPLLASSLLMAFLTGVTSKGPRTTRNQHSILTSKFGSHVSQVVRHLQCPDFVAGTGQLTLNSLWSWGRKGRGAGNSQQTAAEAISQVGSYLSNAKA